MIMDKLIRTIILAAASLALYNEAKKAGLVDKAKPYLAKMREKVCPQKETNDNLQT